MNAITREDLANFISDSTALAFLSASGSGTDWDFLGFETFEDENGEYHWLDIYNQPDSYGVYYQYQRMIEDEDGDLYRDEEFGQDTIINEDFTSLEELKNFLEEVIFPICPPEL